MKRTPVLLPSPSRHRVPNVLFSRDRSYLRERSRDDFRSDYLFTRAFHAHVSDVLHRFGIYNRCGTVRYNRTSARITLELEAGEWSGQVNIRSMNRTRVLTETCFQILRLAEREIEHLG